jgi:hypothetical protein
VPQCRMRRVCVHRACAGGAGGALAHSSRWHASKSAACVGGALHLCGAQLSPERRYHGFRLCANEKPLRRIGNWGSEGMRPREYGDMIHSRDAGSTQ